MKQQFYSLLLAALLSLPVMKMQARGGLDVVTIGETEYYAIATADDLVAFAQMVNGGETAINAVLTDNIDLQDVEWTPIGNSEAKYSGTFDGQGHAITNFNYTATGDNNGLFGYVINATIKQFSISGTLTTSYTKNGVVGQADGSSVISHIHSALDINVSNVRGHTGGIVGGDSGNSAHKPIVEYCEYSGTLTHTGDGDCQAGIMGYTYNGGVRNCIFSGTIKGGNNKYGGILGYCKRPEFLGVQNCLSIGKIEASDGCTTAAAIIANYNGAATENVKNNYYCLADGSTTTIAIGNKASSCEAPTLVTPEELASGEICYLLNGSQSEEVSFYQTLPSDLTPTLDATHATVYLSGRQHCDGTAYEGASYSNTNSTVVDPHTFADGYCTYCGNIDADYITPNAEGFREIGSQHQFLWFADLVNAGHYDANAVLTDDINMDGADISHFPIGQTDNDKRYIGTFDGQGHKFTNFQLVNPEAATNFGIFNTYTGVVLRNFWLDSTCAIEGTQVVGVVGRHDGGGTFEGLGNCANVTGTNNNVGGLIGAVMGNSSDKKNVSVKNCWTTGKVVTTNTSVTNHKDCGALTGWFNNAVITIEGFWTIAEVTNTRSAAQYVYRNGGGATFTVSNCYSMYGEQPNYPNFTADQLQNGWLCFALNGDQSTISWYQAIGSDPTPVLSDASPRVYELNVGSAGYASFVPEVNVADIPAGVEAFAGQNVGTYLHLEPVGEIPADNAVIVKAEAGSYYYNNTDETRSLGTANDLAFFSEPKAADGSQYCLAAGGQGVGFYKVQAGTEIPARKAYLEVSEGAGVKSFYAFGEDDPTGIADIQAPDAAGHIIYNIAGQHILKARKGINITGGKKVLY